LPTVLRFQGLRFVIWPDDHAPPHVHVFSADGSAKIALSGEADCLRRVDGMSRKQVAVAIGAVFEHRAQLLVEWEKIHGKAD